jgi:uncharacterized protein (DUF697 family)
VVRNSAVINSLVGAEPIPGLAIPFLLGIQARMVLRIAAIYGEPMGVEHAKTLVATIAGGLTLRYLAIAGAKFIPGPGWIVAGTLAGAGTWAIGRVAVQYFEHGKKLSPEEIRRLNREQGRASKRGRNEHE